MRPDVSLPGRDKLKRVPTGLYSRPAVLYPNWSEERWSPLNAAPAANDSYGEIAVGACLQALSGSP
jgi:hypothetical protein